MDPRVIFQAETEFHVSYDPDLAGLYMVWRGYHTTPQFRAQNEQALDALVRHGARKMLCDVRSFVLIGASDQAWLNDDWLPRATAAGLRTCALVAPAFHFNRIAVRTVAERVRPDTIEICFFESPQPARAWLRSTP